MACLNKLVASLRFIFLLVCAIIFSFSIRSSAAGQKYFCPGLAEKSNLTSIGESVYQGEDGWFFRASDFNHLYPVTPDNVKLLKKLEAILRLKNSKLVMIPLPSRGMMAKRFLKQDGIFDDVLYDESFAEFEFRQFVKTMKQQGLAVVDVMGYLDAHLDLDRSEYYFQRNVHWTPRAALWTAAAASDLIQSLARFDQEDQTNYVSSDTGSTKVAYSALNLMLNEACKEKIPQEMVNLFETRNTKETLDAFLVDAEQQGAPAVLVGTSFSAENHPFHFAGFLRSQLQVEVANYAIDGGGMDQALFAWSHGNTSQSSPPKVLIWELPFIDRLPSFSEQSARQIWPAIMGLCAARENSIQELAYVNESKVLMTLNKGGLFGSKLYLSSDLSDPNMRSPRVRLTYVDGQVEEVLLRRPERIQKIDKLFWELSDQFSAGLKSIEIEFEASRPESGTLALCRYPVGVAELATNYAN